MIKIKHTIPLFIIFLLIFLFFVSSCDNSVSETGVPTVYFEVHSDQDTLYIDPGSSGTIEVTGHLGVSGGAYESSYKYFKIDDFNSQYGFAYTGCDNVPFKENNDGTCITTITVPANAFDGDYLCKINYTAEQ